MESELLFTLPPNVRAALIEEHVFHYSDAINRLLSQFNEIAEEATQEADRVWSELCDQVNPEADVSGLLEEAAISAGGRLYGRLVETRESARLTLLSGLYYQWDKSLRQCLVDNIRLPPHSKSIGAVWAQPFTGIVKLMDGLGWDISGQDFFLKIRACHLVVNVHKHGEGGSLEVLKREFPEYLPDPLEGYALSTYDHTCARHYHLRISDGDLKDFSNAIIKFWECIPSETLLPNLTHIPRWFVEASGKHNS